MARRTKEEAEQTRKDILQASLNMFCEKGYTRTTLDDIAKSINLTKGAVYWYFRNKPDILLALIQEDLKNTQEKLEKNSPNPKTLEEMKDNFLFLADMVDNDANFRKLLYFLLFQMEWSVGLVNSFKDTLDEFKSKPINVIKQILVAEQNSGKIASDVDVNNMTCTIHAVWHGLLTNKLSNQDDVSLRQLANYSLDFIINALTSRKD